MDFTDLKLKLNSAHHIQCMCRPSHNVALTQNNFMGFVAAKINTKTTWEFL